MTIFSVNHCTLRNEHQLPSHDDAYDGGDDDDDGGDDDDDDDDMKLIFVFFFIFS